MILNENGETVLSYEWGLGHISNNRAEALALYQGLLQLGKLGIEAASIFGDSTMVISSMAHKREPLNAHLQQTLSRCQSLAHYMKDLRFHHVLRSLNKDADNQANKACARSQGCLVCNGVETTQYLPRLLTTILLTSFASNQ